MTNLWRVFLIVQPINIETIYSLELLEVNYIFLKKEDGEKIKIFRHEKNNDFLERETTSSNEFLPTQFQTINRELRLKTP